MSSQKIFLVRSLLYIFFMTKGLVLILSFYPWFVRDFSCTELKKKNSMGKNILRHILYGLLKGHISNSTNILCISIIHQISIQKYSHAIHIRYIYDRPCFRIRTDTFTYVVTHLMNQLILGFLDFRIHEVI